jgi:glycine/D-amino acid oxidase-like deaminating enzyme/nitrite reductase/ring-hydroxylating ferredoxin subunit
MSSTTNMPNETSGFHDSFWTDSTSSPEYPSIGADMNTEVVVIGAGIAGLSIAYNLVKAGRKVIVLEDGLVGSGETGRTTAHLVNALDDRYFEIEKTFGENVARLAASSHTAAINFIESTSKTEKIECDFRRLDGFLFLHPSDKTKSLQDEFEATRRAGIATELLATLPNMVNHEGPCLRFPFQAQFHPMKYVLGLSKAITEAGGQIFCKSHVSDVTKEGVTVNDFRVTAQDIVVATNSPINDRVTMHTKQHAYRTYVIAAEIPKDSLTPSLWWDTGDQNSRWVAKPSHYVRTQPFNDVSDLLIIGGEDHKTGQAEAENVREELRYVALEDWARKRFPQITNIAYTWSGQVLEPVDMLGFIGRNPGDENIFIVTGDSGNGMTHGTIAGMLICDLIMGKANPWEKIYDPKRITFSTATDFLREAGNMAAQYGDYFTAGDIDSISKLDNDSGAIMRVGAQKVAVYKDASSQLHVFSAVCPHLGCYVRWNGDERSFDCPCHGSRFSCEGKVLNGPAVTDLQELEILATDGKKIELRH